MCPISTKCQAQNRQPKIWNTKDTVLSRQGVVVLFCSVCWREDTVTLITKLCTRTNLVQKPSKMRTQKDTLIPEQPECYYPVWLIYESTSGVKLLWGTVSYNLLSPRNHFRHIMISYIIKHHKLEVCQQLHQSWRSRNKRKYFWNTPAG